jgi:hypothetical protein
LWARFGDVAVEGAPRRRVAGLVAAGLDQLIIPMAESESNGKHYVTTTSITSKNTNTNATRNKKRESI